MSKLIEKLQKSLQPAAPAIGFKTRVDIPKSQVMPFIVAISSGNMNLITDILMTGIDALLLQINENEQTQSALSTLVNKVAGIPWGLFINHYSEEQIEQTIAAGCDFLIFEAKDVPASLSEKSEIGKILMVNQAWHDGLVETVGQIAVDAVILDLHKETALSMLHLMLCQYYADLTDKPLFAMVSPDINSDTMEALHKYGVAGVVIAVKTKSMLKQVANIYEMLSKLPPVKSKRKKKGGLVPSLSPLASFSTEDENEEEI